MRLFSVRIAVFIFFAWIAALLLNIDIYKKANIELNFFGPITDSIILVFIALVIYIVINSFIQQSVNAAKWINISLFLIGICTLFFVSFFYVASFR